MTRIFSLIAAAAAWAIVPSACFAFQIPDLDPDLKIVKGEEHVLFTKRHQLPDSARVTDSVRAKDGIYLILRIERQTRLWKIGNDGELMWEKPIGEGLFQDQWLQADDQENGVRVLGSRFDADGNDEAKREIAQRGSEGALKLRDGGMLFFGSPRDQTDAFATRTDREGKTLWTQKYPAGELPADQPGRLYSNTTLCRGVVLPDSSMVLVGQTGQYGKFGLGKSKLWLLKIDSAGKKLAEAFVDDGYFNRFSHLHIHAGPHELSVHHWKYDTEETEAPNRLCPLMSVFDHDLKPLREFDLTKSMPPNAGVQGCMHRDMLPMPAPQFDRPLTVRWSNEQRDEVQRVEFDTANESEYGSFLSLVSFRDEASVYCLAVDGFMGSRSETPANLLVLKLRNPEQTGPE